MLSSILQLHNCYIYRQILSTQCYISWSQKRIYKLIWEKKKFSFADLLDTLSKVFQGKKNHYSKNSENDR